MKKSKLTLFACLVLVTVMLVSVISCAEPAPAPAPAPAPSPAHAPAPAPSPAPAPAPSPAPAPAPDKTWTLKFAYTQPAASGIAKWWYVPWADMLEEATKGRVKVEHFPASALGKGSELYDACVAGIADIVFNPPTYTPGVFPAHEMVNLPLLGISDPPWGAPRALMELTEKHPDVFAKEYKDVKMLFLTVGGSYMIMTKDKPVRTPADLKGLKLAASGASNSEVLTAMGVTPVALPMPDIYLSVEKGVTDGGLVTPGATQSFKFWEVAKHFSLVNFAASTFYMVMNLETWNSFPKDIQDAIMSVSGVDGAEYFVSILVSKEFDMAMEVMKEQPGIDIINLSDAEMAAFIDAAKPTHNEYIAGLNAKGLPGQALYDDLMSLVSKYRKR